MTVYSLYWIAVPCGAGGFRLETKVQPDRIATNGNLKGL